MIDFGEACRKYVFSGKCSGDCCINVPINKDIVYRNKFLFVEKPTEILEMPNDQVAPMTKSGYCVFLDRELFICKIYDYRPQVCKDYGSKKLECRHLKPSGNERSEASKKQIIKKYARNFEKLRRKLNCKIQNGEAQNSL